MPKNNYSLTAPTLEQIDRENTILREKHFGKTEDFISHFQNIQPVKLTYEYGSVRCNRVPERSLLVNYGLRCRTNLPPQSYAAACEKEFRTLFNIPRVSDNEGLGDARHPILGDIEVKVSLPNSLKISVQQVRVDREIPFYLFFFYVHQVDYLFLGFVPEGTVKSILGAQSHAIVEGDDDREYSLESLSLSKTGVMSENLAILDKFNYYGHGKWMVLMQ